MTDLQIGLLVIGAAAIAGVLIYNRVQEGATRREAQRAFGSKHVDILLDEPAPHRESPVVAPQSAVAPQSISRIDYVIEIEGGSAAALRSQWSALEHRFARRATLAEGGDGKLRAGLQMVSRSGVVAEGELLEFRTQVEGFAAAHGARVSAPEMKPALEAAQQLDRACADVDVQIALHVLGCNETSIEAGPFAVTPRPDGVTLLLDVPRTPDLVRSYQSMVRVAQQLGGRLVDDNGNVLDERALAAIGVEVETLRARLADIGIEPGSPLALRLFS